MSLTDELARPPTTKRRDPRPDSAGGSLEPTRSGRSLENRAPSQRGYDQRGYDNGRGAGDAAEIASLKSKLRDHEMLQSQWKIAQEELPRGALIQR